MSCTRRLRRCVLLVLVAVVPLLGGSECTDQRDKQVREGIAPAVEGLMVSWGELAGAYISAMIRPLPEEPLPEPSLK
jgi:hypothetical protein